MSARTTAFRGRFFAFGETAPAAIACALRAKTFGRKAASYSVPHLFVRFESLAATT
jgi:hypothetical protein